jgi:hypothetical protein
MISEMYEIINKHDKSAYFLVKIANEIPRAAIIVALFFERGAF